MTMIHHQAATEDTVVVTVDWLQRYGRDWLRYPGANVVALSSHGGPNGGLWGPNGNPSTTAPSVACRSMWAAATRRRVKR
jgi:hypothetical protein